MALSAPIAPSTATNLSNYSLEPSGTVLSVRIHSNAPSVVILGHTGSPERVRIRDLEGRLGDRLPPESVATIGARAWMPEDAGQVVHGVQANFEESSFPEGWVATPTTTAFAGLPSWRILNGIAEATAPSVPTSRSYALLYKNGGYDPVRQEVLARIRLRSAPGRIEAGVVTGNSNSPLPSVTPPSGVEWRNLNSAMHLRAGGFINGPTSARTISSGQWFWMRLRTRSDPAAGAPDARARVWLGNGIEPEPTLWESWDIDPALPARSSFPVSPVFPQPSKVGLRVGSTSTTY